MLENVISWVWSRNSNLYTQSPAFVFLSSSCSHVSSMGLISQFTDHFTDGRTPWTGDQHIAGPLPKHSTTQTQNKRIHTPNIYALCGNTRWCGPIWVPNQVWALWRRGKCFAPARTRTVIPRPSSLGCHCFDWAIQALVSLIQVFYD
jgi:hypothetical protein